MPVFNTTDNHQKIALADDYTETVAAFVFGDQTSVNHGLGYIPKVRCFFEPNSNDIWPLTENWWPGKMPDLRCSAFVDEDDITFQFDNIDVADETFPVYYRIYKDSDLVNFDSKQRTEKILTVLRGSVSVPNTSSVETFEIPHGLSTRAFPVLRWSDDNTNWFVQDTVQVPSPGSSSQFRAIAHCTNTNAVIEAYNSYGSSKNLYYQIFLFERVPTNVVVDTRKTTFLNFDSGAAQIEISGSYAAGEEHTWTALIEHGQGDSLGEIYVERSDNPGVYYTFPQRPLDSQVSTDLGTMTLAVFLDFYENGVRIKVLTQNPYAGTATMTPVTLTFRYVLYRVP